MAVECRIKNETVFVSCCSAFPPSYPASQTEARSFEDTGQENIQICCKLIAADWWLQLGNTHMMGAGRDHLNQTFMEFSRVTCCDKHTRMHTRTQTHSHTHSSPVSRWCDVRSNYRAKPREASKRGGEKKIRSNAPENSRVAMETWGF